MSYNTNSRILSLYKSRKTIVELLENLGFDIEEYTGFNINEVDVMFKNDQLDMLLTHPLTGKKNYIKYYCSPKQTIKQIRPQVLDNIIEDLYVLENVLTKDDTLIIIIEDEPNDTIIERMKYLYNHDGIFVIIHNIKRLQFNILNHSLVPKITVLSLTEETEFMDKYKINDKTKIPEISRFDPQALALCIRPEQICKIERDSLTSLNYLYYRVVTAD